VLKNRVDLLDPKHVDPDMADELTRKELGVVGPDEVILPLN
jgi:cell division protein FtsB